MRSAATVVVRRTGRDHLISAELVEETRMPMLIGASFVHLITGLVSGEDLVKERPALPGKMPANGASGDEE